MCFFTFTSSSAFSVLLLLLLLLPLLLLQHVNELPETGTGSQAPSIAAAARGHPGTSGFPAVSPPVLFPAICFVVFVLAIFLRHIVV
jgi:hypothetical protein